jgi:hypothetical protein
VDPQLRGDEQLVAGDAAGLDGAAVGLLVAVGGGSVQVAVAGGESVEDDLLRLIGGDLEDAEPEDGHLHAEGGRSDNYGSARAAQPGKSQGAAI